MANAHSPQQSPTGGVSRRELLRAGLVLGLGGAVSLLAGCSQGGAPAGATSAPAAAPTTAAVAPTAAAAAPTTAAAVASPAAAGGKKPYLGTSIRSLDNPFH